MAQKTVKLTACLKGKIESFFVPSGHWTKYRIQNVYSNKIKPFLVSVNQNMSPTHPYYIWFYRSILKECKLSTAHLKTSALKFRLRLDLTDVDCS